MAAPRALQLGLRRVGLQTASSRLPTTSAGRLLQRRLVATEHLSNQSAADSILAKQRLKRPVSPHLSIYRPQITWYLSMFHRITGSVLSGGFYIFGFAYLIAPAAGWHLETPSLVAAVAGWPVIAKVTAKFAIAFPFVFHCLNGLRHLSWDLTIGISNKAVARSGWLVVGLSALGSLALTFM